MHWIIPSGVKHGLIWLRSLCGSWQNHLLDSSGRKRSKTRLWARTEGLLQLQIQPTALRPLGQPDCSSERAILFASLDSTAHSVPVNQLKVFIEYLSIGGWLEEHNVIFVLFDLCQTETNLINYALWGSLIMLCLWSAKTTSCVKVHIACVCLSVCVRIFQ